MFGRCQRRYPVLPILLKIEIFRFSATGILTDSLTGRVVGAEALSRATHERCCIRVYSLGKVHPASVNLGDVRAPHDADSVYPHSWRMYCQLGVLTGISVIVPGELCRQQVKVCEWSPDCAIRISQQTPRSSHHSRTLILSFTDHL